MITLNVSGIGCNSCVSKITRAIHAQDPAAKVYVDGSLSAERLNQIVQQLGFDSQIGA